MEISDLLKVFCATEIRIGFSFGDEVFDDNLIDIGTDALLIWAISAFIAIREISFVSDDAEFGKLVDELVSAAGDGSLGVGVL